jgi:hypothetical protein
MRRSRTDRVSTVISFPLGILATALLRQSSDPPLRNTKDFPTELFYARSDSYNSVVSKIQLLSPSGSGILNDQTDGAFREEDKPRTFWANSVAETESILPQEG